MAMENQEASRLYTYYRQSLTICRPYMSEQQALMYESRFAALRSRDQYLAIVNDLKRVADSNDLRLPDYHPW
jgi:hypothetical protein